MSLRRAGLTVLSLTPLLLNGQTKPPTVDPTYGFPLPKLSKTVAKQPLDANWIWTASTKDTQTIYARKSFTLKATGKATLFVTADNFFTAYVNGVKVGGTENDPNDNLVWSNVHGFDISSLLKPGINQIALIGVNAGSAAGLLARVHVSGKPVAFTDKTWKVTETQPGDDWTTAGFDDHAWENATVEGEAGMAPWGSQLKGWPVPLTAAAPYLAHLPIAPVQWSAATDVDHLQWSPAKEKVHFDKPAGVSGQWGVLVDFGKELSGRLVVKGYSGDIELGTGESAGEALEKPYTGSKTTTTPYSAFRYATLKFPASVDHVDADVVLDHLYYPVQYRGSFDCSDPLLTQVWYTGVYTAHLCMQEDIWDAPKRDRARWMGDLHVSGEVINNAFADKFLMEQTIRRLRDDAQGGAKPGELPRGHVNGIPGYSCAWVAGLADLYRHIGNKEYVVSQHDNLVSLLEFLRQEFNENGQYVNTHKQWAFVDWAPNFNGDHPEALAATHLFTIKALKEAVFLFHELGDEANATKYTQWAQELTASAQKYLVGPAGTFGDLRQENAMAIDAGVATPAQVQSIYDAVLKPGAPAWDKTVSPYYGNYVLRALSESGHTQDGLDYIRNFWGAMIKDGATTFYEGYDPTWDKHDFHSHLQADDGTGFFVSLCHGWSAGPVNYLTERILGIRVTGGAFKTCEIAPELGDLAWASGAVPTPHGLLTAKVGRAGGTVTMTLSIPAGTQATLAPVGTVISVDGKPATGTPVVGPGSHIFVYKAG